MDVISETKQAVKYTKEKNFEAAEKIYLKILKKDKDNPVILTFLGLLYMKTRCGKLAEKYLEKAASIKKNQILTESLGFVKYRLDKYEEACGYFSEAIKTNKNFNIYDKYIKSLINSRSFSKAYECAYECFQKYPFNQEALYNLIDACIHAGRLKEASHYGKQIIVKYPKYALGWLTYGLLAEMLYYDDKFAFECYKKALRLGEKSQAYCNLAISSLKTGEYGKALRYLKKSVNPLTNMGELHFLISTIYFKQRKFKKAFRHYALKEHDINFRNPMSKLKHLWDGKTYKNETLLLYMDQGRGDCIMFSRYLPFLEKKFKHINMYAPWDLKKLFKRSFSGYKKVSFHSFSGRFLHYDKSVAASNLPYYLKMDNGEFPFPEGYLNADTKKIKYYKTNYFNTNEFKVGICWEAGGAGWREQIHRTLNIELFEPILDLAGVKCYSFQVKPTVNNYKNYPDLVDLGSTFKDFDDTAAAIMNLDLLISVDTSVVHLAGALGVRTFMLLPYVTDWRWFDAVDKTEWYNSVNIFKQQKSIGWEAEIEKIKREIEQLLMNVRKN